MAAKNLGMHYGVRGWPALFLAIHTARYRPEMMEISHMGRVGLSTRTK